VTAAVWSFHLHAGAWLVVLGLGAVYGTAVRRPGWQATPRQVGWFFLGLVFLLVALTWPIADLAAHWSLTALVIQRLILLLAVPSLLIVGTPPALLSSLTRPAPVDAAVRTASRPAVAVLVVTVVAVATLTVPAVKAQASSGLARALLEVLLILTGAVLWAPVLDRLPGTHRPAALGRAAYLVVQSIVPGFLAIIWIFARHPLYPPFAGDQSVAGLSPILDQQLAGFVAKLGTIIPLWTVAFVTVVRAQRTEDRGGDPDPLRWSDVERHLERAERRQQRTANPGFPLAPPKPRPAGGHPAAPASGSTGAPEPASGPGTDGEIPGDHRPDGPPPEGPAAG